MSEENLRDVIENTCKKVLEGMNLTEEQMWETSVRLSEYVMSVNMDQTKFLGLINAEKFHGIEFKITDGELEKRGYATKGAYLLSNMFIAVENIRKEVGYHEYQIMDFKKPSEKMRNELVFIAAVCEELLRE